MSYLATNLCFARSFYSLSDSEIENQTALRIINTTGLADIELTITDEFLRTFTLLYVIYTCGRRVFIGKDGFHIPLR